ncbi:hypothetical protein [Microvirga thermotolerans]|nr:hypothetical protein [Microvirga thermotolerans]
MEDILRKRDAFAGRIALGIGCALALSSIAFAGYAIRGGLPRSDFPMAVPSLHAAVQGDDERVAFRVKETDPVVTGSIGRTAPADSPASNTAVADESNPGRGYVLRKVLRRGALVEGPDGLREVSPGTFLPGAGRVISIFRSESGWVVVTSETVIREGAVLGLGNASGTSGRTS